MPRWPTFELFLADASSAASDAERQALAQELLAERSEWPWVEHGQATFIYSGDADSVALNLDTIQADPPFVPLERLEGTNLWHLTRSFAQDDLLDYMLVVDDPMTPLATEPDIVARVAAHWRPDPLNPLHMDTASMKVSVLRMNAARPFPDWSTMRSVARGRVFEHLIDSSEVGFHERKLWVYTPPGYDGSGMAYPLLIMEDGQWAVGPLQVPYIADALIKHERMQPAVIAMIQSGSQEDRTREYIANDRHYAFLLTELLPFLQPRYRVDSTRIAVAGVAIGAAAAAHAALTNPAVFSSLMMISPPLGKGPGQDQLREYTVRFASAELLPQRIFQSVGRYEARGRFFKPAQTLNGILSTRSDLAYRFVETGSGHGLVGFASIMPEALAWILPGAAAQTP
jgi:enterochelin esterase-like enzyme